jgi:hypothetical protein
VKIDGEAVANLQVKFVEEKQKGKILVLVQYTGWNLFCPMPKVGGEKQEAP